jgi:hypothetical protein
VAAAQSTDEGAAPSSEARPIPPGQSGLAARAAAVIAGRDDPGAPGGAGGVASDDDAADGDQAQANDDAARRPARSDENDPDAGDGDDPDEAGEDDPDEDDPDDAGGPVASLDDAAKRLGLTRAEFNAIPVQVGDKTLTLGELKARLPDVLKLDARATELDDERGSWELERVASYRNINAILDALPRNAVTQGVLHTLQRQHEEARARELESLHFARPRWADPTYSTGARERILGMAKEYGFSRAEINGLMDHRMVLLAQDYAELRAKVKESRDAARKVNEPGGNRPNGQAGPARAGAAAPTNHGARVKETQAGLAARAGAIVRRR